MKLNKEELIHNDFENQPKGTEDVVLLRDIKIPQDFSYTRPLVSKMKRCRERYNKLGYLDKPITIIAETNEFKRKNKLILVDGYSRYLYAKENLKLKYIPVKYIDINEYCNKYNI